MRTKTRWNELEILIHKCDLARLVMERSGSRISFSKRVFCKYEMINDDLLLIFLWITFLLGWILLLYFVL